MENNLNYKLIDGTFSVEEAEKILTTLFNYKIDYHNREDFSNYVRFNENIRSSKNRIEELKNTQQQIQKMMNEIKNLDLKLVIKGTITITLEKNDK